MKNPNPYPAMCYDRKHWYWATGYDPGLTDTWPTHAVSEGHFYAMYFSTAPDCKPALRSRGCLAVYYNSPEEALRAYWLAFSGSHISCPI